MSSNTSCIVINEKLLPPNSAPVSTLNPAFVTWQPLGRRLKQHQVALPGAGPRGGTIGNPLEIGVELLSDSDIRQAFQDLSRTAGCAVHAYPIHALTGNYEAYARALKLSHSGDIRYLAVSCLLPGMTHGRTLLNAAFADASLHELARDASILGLATGYHYPDETYSRDVTDADGLCHPYLTCIGHFFRKEKGQKLARFAQASSEALDALTFMRADSSNPAAIIEESLRMAVIWASTGTLKALKLNQMSSARMHEELVQYKKVVDEQFGTPAPGTR